MFFKPYHPNALLDRTRSIVGSALQSRSASPVKSPINILDALTAIDGAPSSATKALEAASSDALNVLGKAFSTSAMQAEAGATDAANRLQKELLQMQFDFNAEEARKNRLFQQASAREAMQFSERQAATQWQRAVKDMRQAGINPIYAFQAGGNSSASGVAASGSAASGGLASAQAADFSSAKSADLAVLLSSLSSLLTGLTKVLLK